MRLLNSRSLERLYELASDTAGEPLLNGDATTRALLAVDPQQVMAMVDEIEDLRAEVKHLNHLLDVEAESA